MDFTIKKTLKDKIREGYFDIPYFAHEILEIDTHEDQDICLRGMRAREHSAITTGNRWGKGDTIKIYGAYLAAYKPVHQKFRDKHIHLLNTSISQDQANIVFDKFIDTIKDKPRFSWLIKDVKKSPFPHIIFGNKVTWWFRNASQDGKFLEGRSYFFANFDEADLQRNFKKFIDDILSPRLWDFGGFLSWTTTPRRGKRNAYLLWNEVERKIASKKKKLFIHRGDSRKNKFLHPSAIEKMNNLPQRLFRKNVLGLYEDTEGVIPNDSLDYAEIIADGLQANPSPGSRYIHAWDLARSSTYLVGVTLEVSDPLQLRSVYRHREDSGSRNKRYWERVAKLIKDRQKKWGGRTAIDSTGLGDPIGSFIADINPILVNLGAGRGAQRADIISEGVACLQLGQIGIPSTIEQIEEDGQLWTPRDELSDFDPDQLQGVIWDFVCALFIAIWIAHGKKPSSKSKRNSKPVPSVVSVKGASRNDLS